VRGAAVGCPVAVRGAAFEGVPERSSPIPMEVDLDELVIAHIRARAPGLSEEELRKAFAQKAPDPSGAQPSALERACPLGPARPLRKLHLPPGGPPAAGPLGTCRREARMFQAWCSARSGSCGTARCACLIRRAQTHVLAAPTLRACTRSSRLLRLLRPRARRAAARGADSCGRERRARCTGP